MQKTKVTRGSGLLEGFLARKRANLANSLIPSTARLGRILDIGCGTTPHFLINTNFKEKFGLDPAVKTSGLTKGIKVTKFNVESCPRLPFKSNFFDVVTMLAVFEHISPNKLPHLLSEIRRVLKPNGRLILTTPCPWADRLLRIMAGFGLVSTEEIEEHKGAYTLNSLAKYLESGGFTREKMHGGYFELFLNNWFYADK